MELTPEMIVTVAGMSASVITSFAIVRTKVNNLEAEIKDVQHRLNKLDTRLDRNDTSTDLVSQRLSVISGMMDPQNRERLHRSLERLQVESETLRRDVDILHKMHNGRHNPVSNEKVLD